jgi:hypothetical protein
MSQKDTGNNLRREKLASFINSVILIDLIKQ